MGQAKQRGTKEQRITQAKAKLAALRPETLVCGTCQTAFPEFEAMDTRGMRGVDAVFAGQCPSCGESVIAFKGEPDAVADAALAWQGAMGGDAKLGSQSSDGGYLALEDE